MQSPPIPDDEPQRLAALAEFEILDTEPEANFDDLVEFATQIAGAPIAMISLIDAQRQWFKACVGLGCRQTPREQSLCAHVVGRARAMVVDDTLEDPRFADNPLVVGGPKLRAYAGFPLRTQDGFVLGSLCVADVEPRAFSSEQQALLEGLAARTMRELELRRQLRVVEREKQGLLAAEAKTAALNNLLRAVGEVQHDFLLGRSSREVFAAVLEHFLLLTDSEFGFIGEVFYDEPKVPYLVTHAISDIAWSEETRRFYADRIESGIEFRNLDTLFGRVMTSKHALISNEPQTDPRSGGLPPGHPTLHSFMGLPILKAGKLLGMLGVANRPGGYGRWLDEFLSPFLSTCAGLFEARRAEEARLKAQRRLQETLDELRQSRDELARFLDLLSVGTVVVDSKGSVRYVSKTGRALAGVDERALGRAWTEVLPVDERARAALAVCLTMREEERSRVGARLGVGDSSRPVEIDVRDDPRDPKQRIMFIYDVSELFARGLVLERRHPGIVGDSAAMRELYDAIDQVAAGSWTVLIEGETGAGKELVARAIHQASSRRDKAFVAVNCAGLTDTLLGSQLFGHIKGAFTGATSDRRGLFEAASGGTIFLDEIGDISLEMQRALLRVLQEREITRVGETHPRKVDVRVLAATHRDIQAMAERGEFRQDLVYRIRIVRLSVPPLRDRIEDIPALVSAFLANEQVTSGKDVRSVGLPALRCLTSHAWPGNVRELRGVIEHAVVHCRTNVIELADLPLELRSRAASAPAAGEASGASEREALDERGQIIAALREAGGNRSRAARLLGIGRATLYRRLDALEIDLERALAQAQDPSERLP